MTRSPVLYVEDEPDDVALVRLAFKRVGVDRPLVVVTDGRAALEYLLGIGQYADRLLHPMPCFVLLDLNLPQLSGLEVLQEVRRPPKNVELAIVVFTSSAQAADRTKAIELGAADYVTKPPRFEDLTQLVRTLRDRWFPTGSDIVAV